MKIMAKPWTLWFLTILLLALPYGVFAAMARDLGTNFDGTSGTYPAISSNLPVVPEVPLPAPAGPVPAPPERLSPAAGAWDAYFGQLGGEIGKDDLTDSGLNKLTLLVDGQEVIDSAAPDIARARAFIHIEVFQWEGDGIGVKFRDILAEKVKEGVRVRVILDRIGSSLMVEGNKAHKFVNSMREAGIEVKVRRFQLLHLDHRKVIVMDDGAGGLVGYTGGMNIGDDYIWNWHDQQTRVSGPAVTRLHRSFLENWKKVAGEELSGFPLPCEAQGGARTYVITHIGGDTDRNIKKAYLLAIATARELIRIEDPYFTDGDIISALIKAATDPRRPGLKVQLIVPEKDDMQVTLRAFRSHYKELLKAGIEVYEYQPRMEHLKVAVMDHVWATVGSSNLDPQSLKYNNEMNLLVLDRAFARELDTRIFDKDIPQSRRITNYNFDLADAVSGHLPFLSPTPPAGIDLAGL